MLHQHWIKNYISYRGHGIFEGNVVAKMAAIGYEAGRGPSRGATSASSAPPCVKLDVALAGSVRLLSLCAAPRGRGQVVLHPPAGDGGRQSPFIGSQICRIAAAVDAFGGFAARPRRAT